MTPEDQKFKAWLESQPDDRVFTVDTCGCPLACYAREVHKVKDPAVGLSLFWDTRGKYGTISVESARRAVSKMCKNKKARATIKARKFKAQKNRSRTYRGIARAMAEQWGACL